MSPIRKLNIFQEVFRTIAIFMRQLSGYAGLAKVKIHHKFTKTNKK